MERIGVEDGYCAAIDIETRRESNLLDS